MSVHVEAELLVNAAPYETRVARVENGRVEELYIERVRGIRGNIYKGRVVRVVPGIQAAFVEIGLERAGFLYAGDILRPSAVEEEEEEELAPNGLPPITSLVEEGQELLVQVAREPIGGKGPRLTTQIGLPGRYLVLLPNNPRIAIAKRLEDAEEIARLRAIAEAIRPENHGLIVRTVAHGRSEEELKRDLAFLLRIWGDIAQRARHAVPGSLLYKDLDLPLKVMRDYVDDRVVRIHVDSRETYERMLRFAERFMPEVKSRIFYYPGERPIFSLYGVEEEIARALLPRVPLRSGGCLVIEQTEALVAIDVNSGTKSATKNLEETGFKTNLEAVQEIVHQIRLRNLGGIIIIDFIDMKQEEHRKRVLEALEQALARDHAHTEIVQFSPLGLVEMTRKRTRDTLARTLLASCPTCRGSGMVKSLETVCHEIFRELVAEARAYPCSALTVQAHPEVIRRMQGEEAAYVAQIERFLKKPIRFEPNPELAIDAFEVMLN